MKYRAFLSYSHADGAFAENFHRQLEGWRADRGLVGRETPNGPAPRDVRPIFRDRDDFAGGKTLGEATREALEASDFMILLCSPAAAKSEYVDAEIRAFKGMGGGDRIIPVIIDGEPGDAARNCFPPALVRKVDEDGELTDEIEERLAADARDQGDGPRRALAKVIAGLLGVPFDEIVRRAEAAQRRRTRIVGGVAATMAVLAVAAGAFGWLAETRRVAAERNYQAAISAADSLLGEVGEELIRTEGVGLETTKRLIGRSEAIYDDLAEALPDAREVKLGKVAALGVFARAYSQKGDMDAASAALTEAERLTEELLADTPEDERPAGLSVLRAARADLISSAGDRTEARRLYAQSLDGLMSEGVAGISDASMARFAAGLAIKLGLHEAFLQDAEGAEKALETLEALVAHWLPAAADDDEEIEWLIVRSSGFGVRLAIAQAAQDDAAGLAHSQSAVALLDEMAARRPDLAGADVALASFLDSTIYFAERLGRSDVAEAAAARKAETIVATAQADLENLNAQIRLAALDGETAIERMAEGDEGALAALQEALGLLEEIDAAAPGQVYTQEVLQALFFKAAPALNDAGYHAEALATAERLIGSYDAADPERRGEFAFALDFAAKAADALGRTETAFAYADRVVAIREAQFAAGEIERGLLAQAEWDAGVMLWRLSRREEAEARYERIVAHYAAMAAAAPDDVGVGGALSWTCVNLGELKALNGDVDGARAVFAECLANAERVIALAPDDRQSQLDLAWAEARMALIGVDAGARWPRVAALLTAADAEAPLGDLEDELLTVARIASAAD